MMRYWIAPSLLACLGSTLIAAEDPPMIDLAVTVAAAAGISSVDSHTLGELQVGGHDPNRNGFTFQQAELYLGATVDPYFRAESIVVASEEGLELEEAFAQTTSLPYGLQVEAGYFLTEVGYYNPRHPHVWTTVDRPLTNGVLLGEEGMRGAGVRVGVLLPTSWFAEFHLGAQNADDATMTSFLGEGHDHGHEGEDEHGHGGGIGGREPNEEWLESVDRFEALVYLARLDQAWDLSDQTTVRLGLSGLYGGNTTGDDGQTLIGAIDLTLKWQRPGAPRNSGQLTWITEAVFRQATLAAFTDDMGTPDPLDDEVFEEADILDWGLTTEVAYEFAVNWRAGVRLEYLSLHEDADEDPEDRIRVSPNVSWAPTEFSRLRLQYNYDDHPEIDDPAHSVFLSLEVSYGAHPAHDF